MPKKNNKKLKIEGTDIDLTEISKLIVCGLSYGMTKTEIIMKLTDFGFDSKRIGILLNRPTKNISSILIKKSKKKKKKGSQVRHKKLARQAKKMKK